MSRNGLGGSGGGGGGGRANLLVQVHIPSHQLPACTSFLTDTVVPLWLGQASLPLAHALEETGQSPASFCC